MLPAPATSEARDSPAATGGSGNSADSSDPIGGMAAVTGSLTVAETCERALGVDETEAAADEALAEAEEAELLSISR